MDIITHHHLTGKGWDTYESLEHLAQLVDGHGWEGHQFDGIYVLCIILGDRVGMS
jgi:hypothetical protein